MTAVVLMFVAVLLDALLSAFLGAASLQGPFALSEAVLLVYLAVELRIEGLRAELVTIATVVFAGWAADTSSGTPGGAYTFAACFGFLVLRRLQEVFPLQGYLRFVLLSGAMGLGLHVIAFIAWATASPRAPRFEIGGTMSGVVLTMGGAVLLRPLFRWIESHLAPPEPELSVPSGK